MVLPHLQSSFGFNVTSYLILLQPCLLLRAFLATPSHCAFLATPFPTTPSWPRLPHGDVDCSLLCCGPRIKPSSLNRLLAKHLVTAMSGYCTLCTRSQRNCCPCRFGRLAHAVAGSHEQILLHGGKVGSRLLPLPTGKRFILIYKAAQLCVIIP